MEMNPNKIITNIHDGMADIRDWTSIADATAANGKNSFHVTQSDVISILTAIKESQAVIPGKIDGGFQVLPDAWDPYTVAEDIFADSSPAGAMMELP